jgi:hypothetical protein
VQDYAPGNWAVKDGFFTEGKPTIYLQAPNGKVLHRQDDYSDGAAGLATALRKADPNYSPLKTGTPARTSVSTCSPPTSQSPS